jgi:hypothetical protein
MEGTRIPRVQAGANLMNLLPWSYTKLTSFERCPRYGRAKYITKELPYVESEAAKEGKELHAAVDAYVGEGEPMPPKWSWAVDYIPQNKEGDLLLSELEIFIDSRGEPCTKVNEPWFWFKLDMLQIEDADIAWIMDWKTGKPWEDPEQLNVYSSGVKAHYPYVRHWRGMYIWLKERRIGEVHTLSPARTFNKLVERVKAVDTSDVAKRNKLCPWCDLTTCEHYTGKKGK